MVRGPSGSGKSTLLALLMAALRPRAGDYRLGDVPAGDLAGADIRRHVAWCPQDAVVFASTVRANLSLGRPAEATTEATADAADVDSRLWTVLRRVGLAATVAGLPYGLDTRIGADQLSGGERRRLAVARTMLSERDVVLLDEPTALLDPPAARALLADLRRALADRTVVCVTHDPGVEAPGDTVVDLGLPVCSLARCDRPPPGDAVRRSATSA